MIDAYLRHLESALLKLSYDTMTRRSNSLQFGLRFRRRLRMHRLSY